MITKLINLNRITVVQTAVKEDRVYLVFQDGRHNYGYKVKDLETAQAAISRIEKGDVRWWRVYGDPVEVTFKRENKSGE